MQPNGMRLLATHLAHKTDYCTFELDEYRDEAGAQMLLAHLHVHKWTPSYLKQIKRDWATFRTVVTAPLYAIPPKYDPKWIRFVNMMGWCSTFSSVLCHDGIERPLYIHTI